jgi:hypothetical protein
VKLPPSTQCCGDRVIVADGIQIGRRPGGRGRYHCRRYFRSVRLAVVSDGLLRVDVVTFKVSDVDAGLAFYGDAKGDVTGATADS